MRSLGAIAVAAALLASAQAAAAQTPQLAVEVRGSYGIPTGDWNEEELFENAFGVGATVSAMVSPQIGIYAGWEMHQFSIDEEALTDEDVDADADGTDKGFRVGVAGYLPMASQAMTPFVELGAIYNSFEISASDGDNELSIESDAAVGFEAGVGLAIQLGQRLQLTPSVRYRQHDVEFDDFGGGDTVEYVTVGVGLRVRI